MSNTHANSVYFLRAALWWWYHEEVQEEDYHQMWEMAVPGRCAAWQARQGIEKYMNGVSTTQSD